MTASRAHPDTYLAELRADVRAGLTAEPKSLPPKYFYDERGSELFEEITRLPEYYPTRAETAILRARAGEIAELSRCESLVELGSGTSAKTGLLLRALRESGTLREFMPFDVDPAVLADATEALTTQYPGLRIVPFVGDFEHDLGEIPAAKGRRMIAFLGSTIGNLEPPARASLYRNVAGVLAGGDMFLLGTDLVKDTGRLLRAYNDSAGVTAEFNRNVLKVINRELRADFDVEEFEHVAIWDAEREWIEMRLRSVGGAGRDRRRPRPDGVLRRGRRDADRGVGEIPSGRYQSRASRRRLPDTEVLDRPRRRLRAHPRRAGRAAGRPYPAGAPALRRLALSAVQDSSPGSSSTTWTAASSADAPPPSIPESYATRSGSSLGLFLVLGDQPTSALPEGWRDRLVKVQNANTADISGGQQFIGWCLNPEDLCVAKLCAFREKDQNFVAALLTADLVDSGVIAARLATVPERYRRSVERAVEWLASWA